MRIDIRLLMLGTLLFLAPGCRGSSPPPTDICIGDGFGGADCTLSDGTHAYKSPSDLKNSFILPDQKQAQNFVAWCYDTSSSNVAPAMAKIQEQARR